MNIIDDAGAAKLIWQKYAFVDTSNTIWENYTLDINEQEQFVQSARGIGVSSYADATSSPAGNVTINRLDYTWSLGKIFQEPQDLFIKVKIYTFESLLQNAKLIINGDDSQTVGGWGETFNFTAEARDRFGRNVTVFVWSKKGAVDYK